MEKQETISLCSTSSDNMAAAIVDMVAFSVCHEMGHVTHVHHHNLNHPKNIGKEAPGWFTGLPECPMRYWARTGNFEEAFNYQWYLLYFLGNWHPANGLTPLGTKFKYCDIHDDCFHQMELRRR